ncbi:MTCP1 domain-containing protein [Lasiodiplodia theobromae]|uniref:MTCP1 domain-containing protein n=1 Tax=Lasiodiplodia theobromae TaxID=45133 RepID=A0A8H7IQF3_9PEZI|nr:MTCP1 domain-containing protein [Lasiodiplodia theobromae]KAF4536722.1 MTCP1 domain-containing protein [Lasiodiplodia theobromae]KAF9629836.1 MTCP1 domain-containing protein [Lasiodiplodia theobromae]
MAGDGKSDTPWTESAAATFDGKQYSQYFDPCQEAASKSLRCLHRNGGDRDMCSDYFQYAPPAGARALSPRFWPPRTDQLTPPSANTGFARAYRDCKKQWMEARKEAKRKEGKSLW